MFFFANMVKEKGGIYFIPLNINDLIGWKNGENNRKNKDCRLEESLIGNKSRIIFKDIVRTKNC